MTEEDYSGYHFDPKEDEGNLSDLDPEEISEYIVSEPEVESIMLIINSLAQSMLLLTIWSYWHTIWAFEHF